MFRAQWLCLCSLLASFVVTPDRRSEGPEHEGVNHPWQLDNRNKRSIALNLTSPASRPALESLVRWADVLVTNFPPHTRKKLGLERDALSSLNPRLIYADVIGFGEEGPEAHRPSSSCPHSPGKPCCRQCGGTI